MQPILNIEQIREWDKYTIENEPIASIDLMERAAISFTKRFLEITNIEDQKILVIASKGNNGGDGLVVGRKLDEKGYDVDILIADIQPKGSNDFNKNLSRLDEKRIPYSFLNKHDDFPDFSKYDYIVDALFGSGLHRPISGYWADLVETINNSDVKIYSIDIPSGMYTDKPVDGVVMHCDTCITFETNKLGMLVPENSSYLKNLKTISIGLKHEYLQNSDFRMKQQQTKFPFREKDRLPLNLYNLRKLFGRFRHQP